jgi:hypothetical protein
MVVGFRAENRHALCLPSCACDPVRDDTNSALAQSRPVRSRPCVPACGASDGIARTAGQPLSSGSASRRWRRTGPDRRQYCAAETVARGTWRLRNTRESARPSCQVLCPGIHVLEPASNQGSDHVKKAFMPCLERLCPGPDLKKVSNPTTVDVNFSWYQLAPPSSGPIETDQAGVAELVDAHDSKSCSQKECGFDSLHRHQMLVQHGSTRSVQIPKSPIICGFLNRWRPPRDAGHPRSLTVHLTVSALTLDGI